MGEYVNTGDFNVVAWVTSVAMIVLTLVLVYAACSIPAPCRAVAVARRYCYVAR